ncbi:hypothetical protein PsorP6_010155 [Peronosclerospora sorghi]|uniref:Uncharacterized protein n=1 Tax=Peronosclerospora sorghi TaxID=230839 RepID=A0ACC0VVU2_9STRA|nr:hypothetical protein PsorP6_010155 [Peronosclerospora sorghi]
MRFASPAMTYPSPLHKNVDLRVLFHHKSQQALLDELNLSEDKNLGYYFLQIFHPLMLYFQHRIAIFSDHVQFTLIMLLKFHQLRLPEFLIDAFLINLV